VKNGTSDGSTFERSRALCIARRRAPAMKRPMIRTAMAPMTWSPHVEAMLAIVSRTSRVDSSIRIHSSRLLGRNAPSLGGRLEGACAPV
jgi:hypothetical protein